MFKCTKCKEEVDEQPHRLKKYCSDCKDEVKRERRLKRKELKKKKVASGVKTKSKK